MTELRSTNDNLLGIIIRQETAQHELHQLIQEQSEDIERLKKQVRLLAATIKRQGAPKE